MPDLSEFFSNAIDWLTSSGLLLAILAFVLLLVYRWARPAIHRVLVRLMDAQSAALGSDAARRVEVEKHVATIEDLLTKALRSLVVVALVVAVLGALDLWPALAGLGLVIAAITLAGQAIILDYLMGILILVEGQFFKGDLVRVGAVEGTVEEVGLRRLVVRDAGGTVHSISNGLIRSSANRTRSFAIASVQIDGIADADVESAIAVLDRVGQSLADDPAFEGILRDVPGYSATTGLSALGATLLMTGGCEPEHRAAVETELRRRVAASLAADGIEPIRPRSGATTPS
jgi:moderate conductance mechanosensitive channel